MIKHGEWWLSPHNVLQGEFLHPQGARRLDLYRRLKLRLGRSLKTRLHRQSMVSKRKRLTHKPSRTKSSDPSPETLHTPMQVMIASDNSTVVAHINKQGGTHSAELCALVDTVNLMPETPGHLESSPHTRVPKCDRGRSFQKEPDPTHRMVPDPQIFKQIAKLWEHSQMDLFATRLNAKLPLYVSPISDEQCHGQTPTN